MGSRKWWHSTPAKKKWCDINDFIDMKENRKTVGQRISEIERREGEGIPSFGWFYYANKSFGGGGNPTVSDGADVKAGRGRRKDQRANQSQKGARQLLDSHKLDDGSKRESKSAKQ